MESMQQRVAVITGGNRGIGLAVGKRLAELGIHVVVGSRDLAKGKQAAAEIRAGGHSASAFELDVADDASVAAFAAHVHETHGHAHILINNAGVALDRWVPALNVDIEDYRRTLDINVLGVMRCIKAFVPMMREAGSGRVVNVSSELASLTKITGHTVAYRSSKTALNAITRVLADELKDEGILVNSASPGWVKTEMGGDDAPRSPEQGADTIVWLATLPEDGPRGGFFHDRKPHPW